MHDWNVVVTIYAGHFRQAMDFLNTFGELSKTDYFNVLVMKVDDIGEFLEYLYMEIRASPMLEKIISRVMPASMNFNFQTPAEFDAQVTQVIEPWVAQLAGGKFHVRMHRRGFKGRLSSQSEEQFLDHFLKEKLEQEGAMASIGFEDPDYIIDVETVGQRAGVTLWTREQRLRYPFLKLD